MLIKYLYWACTLLLSVCLTSSANAWQVSDNGIGAGPVQAADQPKKRKPLIPDDLEGLHEMARVARQEGNGLRMLQANIKLREKQPLNPDFIVGMAIAYALLGKQNSSYDYIYRLQKFGFSFDFDTIEEMDYLRNTEVYAYLNDLLKKQGQPLGKAESAFSFGAEAKIPVAITWDPDRSSFLVGTAVDGQILAVDESGTSSELVRASAENGLWSITGLTVDSARNRLWVSTAALPISTQFVPTELGQSAIVEFELDSMELIKRYLAPVDGMRHEFGPIVVTEAGDVYVADRLGPMVFRKTADGTAVERFSTHPEMTGFRDMTLGPKGFFLYLTDREKGIFVIDPHEQKAAMLGVPENLNLWGVEGLDTWGDSLIVVQSGANPQRVLRLNLDPSYNSVTEVQLLAVAQKGFDWPTFGVVKDDELYFFANGNVIDLQATLPEVLVMRTEIDPEDQIVAVDMQMFLDKQQALEKQKKAAENQ